MVAGSASVDSALTDWSLMEKNYLRINEHILDKVPSDDLDETMNEARKWLSEIQASDKGLAEALEMFLSLPKTKEGADRRRCSEENYKILYANTRATGGRARFAKYPDEAPRRVDEIVYHYAMNHAKYCHYFYLKGVLEPNYDRRAYKILEDYASELTKDMLGQIILNSVCNNPERAKITHDMLTESAELDPDFKYLLPVVDKRAGVKKVDSKKLNMMVKRHLIEPCKKFLNNSETSESEVIEFDLKWYSTQSEAEKRLKKMLIMKKVREVAISSFENPIGAAISNANLIQYVESFIKKPTKKQFPF